MITLILFESDSLSLYIKTPVKNLFNVEINRVILQMFELVCVRGNNQTILKLFYPELIQWLLHVELHSIFYSYKIPSYQLLKNSFHITSEYDDEYENPVLENIIETDKRKVRVSFGDDTISLKIFVKLQREYIKQTEIEFSRSEYAVIGPHCTNMVNNIHYQYV